MNQYRWSRLTLHFFYYKQTSFCFIRNMAQIAVLAQTTLSSRLNVAFEIKAWMANFTRHKPADLNIYPFYKIIWFVTAKEATVYKSQNAEQWASKLWYTMANWNLNSCCIDVFSTLSGLVGELYPKVRTPALHDIPGCLMAVWMCYPQAILCPLRKKSHISYQKFRDKCTGLFT